MHIAKSIRLRSALYARNLVLILVQAPLGAVHKAEHEGNIGCLSVQKLDVFILALQ